jgi:uncharacterized protein
VRSDVLDILLKKGADVNTKDSTGYTALIYASGKDNVDIVKKLLAKGANVNAKTYDGRTALMIAKEQGYSDIEELLKSNDAHQ